MARSQRSQISFYLDKLLYEEIKAEARKRDLSIRKYLVSLHQKNMNENDAKQNLLEEVWRGIQRIENKLGQQLLMILRIYLGESKYNFFKKIFFNIYNITRKKFCQESKLGNQDYISEIILFLLIILILLTLALSINILK